MWRTIASASPSGSVLGEVHAHAGPVLVEPVAHVEVLLEVVGEREVQERSLGRGELHRRRQPTLHDRQVAHGEVAVEAVDVAVDLEARVRRQAEGIDAGTGNGDRAQLRHGPPSDRMGLDRQLEQVSSNAGSTDRDDAHELVVAVAELGPPYRDLVGRRW